MNRLKYFASLIHTLIATYAQLINFHMHTLFAGTKSKMTFASNSTHVKSCTCGIVFIFTKTLNFTST